MLGQTPASLWPWIGLHGYGRVGVSKGNIVTAFTFVYLQHGCTELFQDKSGTGTEREKREKLKAWSVRMVGRGEIQWVKIKMGHWSTSEGKSERSGWMRGQRENRFFCLCSVLSEEKVDSSELRLHKSEACKQSYLSVFNEHTYTHTHTQLQKHMHVCTVVSFRCSLNDVKVTQ